MMNMTIIVEDDTKNNTNEDDDSITEAGLHDIKKESKYEGILKRKEGRMAKDEATKEAKGRGMKKWREATNKEESLMQ
jgi:hypothetical protein